MHLSCMPYPCLNIWGEGSHWERQEHFHRCIEIYRTKLNYFPLLKDISNFQVLCQVLWALIQFLKGKRKRKITGTKDTSHCVFILLCNSCQSNCAAGYLVYAMLKFENYTQNYFWIVFWRYITLEWLIYLHVLRFCILLHLCLNSDAGKL